MIQQSDLNAFKLRLDNLKLLYNYYEVMFYAFHCARDINRQYLSFSNNEKSTINDTSPLGLRSYPLMDESFKPYFVCPKVITLPVTVVHIRSLCIHPT